MVGARECQTARLARRTQRRLVEDTDYPRRLLDYIEHEELPVECATPGGYPTLSVGKTEYQTAICIAHHLNRRSDVIVGQCKGMTQVTDRSMYPTISVFASDIAAFGSGVIFFGIDLRTYHRIGLYPLWIGIEQQLTIGDERARHGVNL